NTWLRIFLENLFRNTQSPADINDLSVVKFSDNSFALYETVSGRPLRNESDSNIHKLRNPVQKYMGSRSETVFAKTHNAVMNFENSPLIWLEHLAGVIYVIRNPLDMLVSFSDHYNLTIDDTIEAISSPYHRINSTEKGIFQILGGWSNHYYSWFNVENLSPFCLRYEDMIQNPVKSFGKLMKFLRLPKDTPRLKRAIRHSSFQVVSQQENKKGFAEQSRAGHKFFRQGKVGSYRRVLSDDQIAKVIDNHGELMVEMGYLDKNGILKV
ncbi:MAG: sulfotransferase domain-containing protein, partial [Pseudomonadota bacterium]|nr:sulfotransferase domain-containing protein [Pseudomonadota bacterium]